MKKYNSTLSFVDLLFNLLLSFVCLFVLSFLLINPKDDQGKIDPKAEFIITLTWDRSSDDDIDLWVEDPNGNVVFYGKKEDGLMHLDRDDLGMLNDSIELPDGEITLDYNQEIVSIRGLIPGEYIVNIHAYNIKSPIKTNTQVLKLNPYSITCNESIELMTRGQEETVCRFKIDSEGEVYNTNRLPKDLRF